MTKPMKEAFVDKKGTRRKEVGTGIENTKLDPAQQIFDGMYELALKWEKLTNGAAYFELVTDKGTKVQCATKNSKRKV